MINLKMFECDDNKKKLKITNETYRKFVKTTRFHT